MDDKKKFAVLLNYLVNTKSNGRTKKQLAKEMGVDVKTFRHWLNGTYSPQRNKYKAIAKTFNITTEIFLSNLDYYINDNGEITYKGDLDRILKVPYSYNDYIEDDYHSYYLFDRLEELFFKIAKSKGYHLDKDNLQTQLKIRYHMNNAIDEILSTYFNDLFLPIDRDTDKNYLLFKAKDELEEEESKMQILLDNTPQNALLNYMKENNMNIENEIIYTKEKIQKLKKVIQTLEDE